MKLIYKGKFSGNPDDIPTGEHQEGYVKFKEFEDSKELGKFTSTVSLLVTAVLVLLVLFLSLEEKTIDGFWRQYWDMYLGLIFSLLTFLPHELLHAIWFKDEVYLYHKLSHGLLFVVGPETMSKARFVILSACPNVVFGFVPFIIYLFNTKWISLGIFAAFAIGMGVGDYYNIYNAITQMPKGARTYMHGFNSYWYMPKNDINNEA